MHIDYLLQLWSEFGYSIDENYSAIKVYVTNYFSVRVSFSHSVLDKIAFDETVSKPWTALLGICCLFEFLGSKYI